jgi:tetratricopeptide (TPR) repeat protein
MSAPKSKPSRAVLAGIVVVVIATAVAIGIASSNSSKPKGLTTAQLLNKGYQAEKRGQYLVADRYYVSAIKSNPKSAVAYFDLGTVAQFRNHPYLASTYYNKAIQLAPRFVRALYNLAFIESRVNPAKAISLYQRALKVSPGYSSAEYNLGILELTKGNKKLGVTDINLAFAMNPNLKHRLKGSLLAAYTAASK